MGHLNKWQARCRNISSLCIHCKRYSSSLSRILVSPEAWSTFVYTSISSQYATFNLICEDFYLVVRGSYHTTRTFSEATENDILAALMQLLPWVCIIMYIIHVCVCIYVIILFLLLLIIQ